MNLRARLDGLTAAQKTIWLILVWLLLASVLWIWWDERSLPDIRGAWASPGCETVEHDAGTSRFERSMRIDDESRSLVIDFFGDEACATRLFSVAVEGPYDLGPNSMETRGATTARFDLGKLTLTPYATEAAEAFEAAGCGAGGWKLGEGQEITQRGCLGLVPTASTCPTEYDIVKIEDGRLHLGDRTQGLCRVDVYPERFAPTPLLRVEPQS